VGIWTLVPLAILVVSPALVVLALQVFSRSYYLSNVTGDLQFAATFFTPAALTYAVLSRRLIDVGFVLNRSIVFAIVSAIVIVTFIAVEWAASPWLTGMTRTGSTVLGLCVALGLGLSLRYIHTGVDRFVDHVFFWKRHEDETALRRFAHEAAYITDRSTLLERAGNDVRAHTRTREILILVPDGAGSYGTITSNGQRTVLSENDAGIVALRAWHKPVDIRLLANSALRGEFAFPMASRGTLVGVLVCGPKYDGEAYAPDESEALEARLHRNGSRA
jgi:hypothetical protein